MIDRLLGFNDVVLGAPPGDDVSASRRLHNRVLFLLGVACVWCELEGGGLGQVYEK